MAEEEKTPEEIAPDDASASEAENASETETEAVAAPTEEAATEPPAQAPAAPPQAPEPVTPKERRQRARTAKAAKAPVRAAMTPEERQAERQAERRRKAVVRRATRSRGRERGRARPGERPVEALPALRAAGTGQQKTRQGVVVSDRAAKTITVRIDVTRRHPRYQKVVRTSATLHAHDEQGDAHIGDTVIVKESRPLSRTKRWRLVEVVERAR
jgi:small subunit ribosomal protein S17